MKINRYQIVVVSWGIAMFFGYLWTEIFLSEPEKILISWTVAIGTALFIQTWLMWKDATADIAIHITWILISIIGGILTYLGMFGHIDAMGIDVHSFWLALTALGMIVTGIFMKNISYFLLALLYAGPIIFFYDNFVENGLLYMGLIFLVLGFVDALLEYSPLRKHVANFEEEKVV